eukprot:CAMPEP_0198656452 /NCGR_PEP_ID=MMETSP1467-20131203/9846_1 /TAXON_ID=1462469 /ORGANISM="unid. sp., Strain CCMP2135" /LENGTH=96 /DNA_ID=CAMNT_0044392489 /DNA_START=51 /DNA_END=337 /DNA_ORIENTATION=-
MLGKMLLVGFLSAASAFTSSTLRNIPSSKVRSSRTVVSMIDADTLLVALPGMAALGITLGGTSNGVDVAHAAPAMPTPVASAEKIDVTLARYNFKR